MSSNSLLDPPRKRNLGAGTRLEPLRPKHASSSSRTASSSAGPRPNYASSTGALRARVMGTGTSPVAGERRPSSADVAGVHDGHAPTAGTDARKLPANARYAGAKSQPRAPATKRPKLSPAATSTLAGRESSASITRSRSTTHGRVDASSHSPTSPSAGKGQRGSSPKAGAGHASAQKANSNPSNAAGTAFFTGAATAKRRGSATNTGGGQPTATPGSSTGASTSTSHSRGVDTNTGATTHGAGGSMGSAAELETRRRISIGAHVVGASHDNRGSASPMQMAAAAGRGRWRSTGGTTVRVGGALPSAAYDGTVAYCSQQKHWRTDLPETVLQILDSDTLEPPFLTHLWKQAYDDPGAISEYADSYVDFYAFETDAAYRAAVDAQRRYSVQQTTAAARAANPTSAPNENPHLHSCRAKILDGFYACVRCHLPVVSPVYQIINAAARGIAAFSHLNTRAVELQLSSEALVNAISKVAEGVDTQGRRSGAHAQRPSLLSASAPAERGAGTSAIGLVFLVKCRGCSGCLGVLSQDVPAAMAQSATGDEVFYANSVCLEHMPLDMRYVHFDGTMTEELEAADAQARGHRDEDDEADSLNAISRDVDAWFDEDDALDNGVHERDSPSSADDDDDAYDGQGH